MASRKVVASRKSSVPRAVSLFSGAGGMDLGVSAAGFSNLACVEFDPNASQSLRLNAARHGSMTSIVEADVRSVDPLDLAKPGIDLLHGGPPCQSFSLIGKRGSLNDERGMLLFEMIRFARALKPKCILIEQVKGLLSASNQRGESGGVFTSFVRQLDALGYCVKWALLSAADFGVPQLRERVFIVAMRGTDNFSFPVPTHSDAPERLPLLGLKPHTVVGVAIADLPRASPKGSTPRFPNHIDVTPERDRERIHPVREGGFLAGTPEASPDLRQRLTKKDTTKYRRLHRREPSLTLRCGEIFFHPTQDRYLTPREYMRIHGYPDAHELCGPVRSRSGTVRNLDQHRQVANSVPPPLAQAISRRIMEVIR